MSSDRAIAFMHLVGDLQVHVLLWLDGHVDAVRLARALRRLLDAEPVLGCRFVPGPRRPHWERLPDLDRLPLCEIVSLPPDAPPEAQEAAALAYAAEPPDGLHLPMLRVRVFRREAGDLVVLKVNHLATDGGGSKECAYRLADLYDRLGEDPSFAPAPNLRGRRSLMQVAEQLSVADRLRLAAALPAEQRRRRRPGRFLRFPYPEGSPRGARAGGRTYRVRRLSGAPFLRAKSWAKARGATLNDLVNAAYLCALLERIRPPAGFPLRLRNTVDLRRYLPSGRTEAVCNCSSFFYPNLGPLPGGSPDLASLLDMTTAEMQRQKAGFIGLHEWAVLGPMLRALPDAVIWPALRQAVRPDRAPEAYQPALTNIGRIHPERLSFGGVPLRDAHATASVIYPPAFVLSVTGCGDSLSLSSGFCADALDPGEVTSLLDRVVALLAACPAPRTRAS